MLRFVINKELDVTRRQLVNYLINYAAEHHVTLLPYEEKPFALSAYASQTSLSSCTKNANLTEITDMTCRKSKSATKARTNANNNTSSNNAVGAANSADSTNSAIHSAFSGIPIGHIYCLRKWDEVEVDLLACNPDYKVNGAGTALMSRAEDIAYESNCHHMTVMTLEFQARPFYEHLGFRLVAEQKQFAGKSKAYHLTKPLCTPQRTCTAVNKTNHRNLRVESTNNVDAAVNELIDWMHYYDKKSGVYDVPMLDRVKYAIRAVAHDTKACVGGALFETWWGNMTVEMFVIDPLEQHKGYGTQLVQELIRLAHAEHCRRITIFATDLASKKLLSSHGFVQIGEQHDIPHPLQRYWMEKMLE